MGKNRLEAFSDGVIAILITIMVLGLKIPSEPRLSALVPMLPEFLSYLLSFIYLGIYWNNHHHLLHAITKVDGRVLWANLHLLFWLSLIPFTTAWVGETHLAAQPVVAYGVVLFFAGFAFAILARTLIALNGRDSVLAKALGKDRKGNISVVVYFAAIPLAFFYPLIAFGLYSLMAVVWVIPDRRIERNLAG
jgi:uncharacterized membrane protein